MGETVRAGATSRVRKPGRKEGTPKDAPCRVKRRLLRGSLWGGGLFASVLVLFVLRDALVRSPLFIVKQVEIEGSGRVSPEEIRSISGVRPGMHLLSLDARAVSRRLEAHPWIQHATVVKRLPDRVLIKVLERAPALLVRVQGQLFYMDGEGGILDRIQPGGQLDLPLLTGLQQEAEDARRCGKGRDVQQALSLLHALQATPVLGGVSEIRVNRSKGLIFVLEGFPVPVQVGWSGFSAKLVRFEKVLPLLAAQSNAIDRVDLRFSGQIVVRQREGDPVQGPGGDRTKTLAGDAPPVHQTT